MRYTLNLNDDVRFRLTDYGRRKFDTGHWTPDKAGWITAQFHEVIRFFGRDMGCGMQSPIGMEVQIDLDIEQHELTPDKLLVFESDKPLSQQAMHNLGKSVEALNLPCKAICLPYGLKAYLVKEQTIDELRAGLNA